MTPHTLAQLEALTIVPGRPLLVSDADEVLFRFVDTFAEHLEGIGYRFDWSSFRLAGNVRRISDGRTVGQDGIFRNCSNGFSRSGPPPSPRWTAPRRPSQG